MQNRMDLELLKYINVDMKWNIMKKGRTSITRRPRKPGTDSFETKKAGTEKVVDAPLKKRRLLSPGPQTPAVLHEDSGQRCRSNSVSKSQKTKSKTRLRKNNLLKPTKKEARDLNDFSGIELLAAAACSSFIHDNTDHVKDVSELKEHTTPEVNSCNVMILDTQNLQDNGKEVEEEKVACSKELRLHWDLNTVMDEWEKPCDDLLVEPDSQENCTVKLNLEVYNNRSDEVVGAEKRSTVDTNQLSVKHDDSFGKTYESIENLTCSQKAVGTKTVIASKTSVGESSSKSDVVDSLIHSVKCEDLTTSVLQEQTIVPVSEEVMQGVCESQELCKTYIDNKVTSEGPVSEGCGSNVTQDEQAEGDSEDKVEIDYDSPFEDGELREPIESEDGGKDDEFGSVLSEKVNESCDLGQTMESQSSVLVKDAVPNCAMKQSCQADTLERSHIDEAGEDLSERKDVRSELRPAGVNLLRNDESTSFDACKDFPHVGQNRSSNIGDSNSRSGAEKSMGRDKVFRSRNDISGPCVDSSPRVWDLKSNHSRSYNPRGGGGGGYRRPSPCERNINGYGSNRGPPLRRRRRRRSPSCDRYRDRSGFHSQEYHRDLKPCYLDRKPRFSTRSRSRSRSGSPIAWNFQKRKNLDTGEAEATTKSRVVSSERSTKCFDDKRARFREKRQSPQRNPRFDSIGYPERYDHFQFAQRSARFSHMTDHKYKDNSFNVIRKHDAGGVRRFRYAGDDSFETRNRHNFNSFSKDARTPESKS